MDIKRLSYLLAQCVAVVIDNDAVVYPSVSELTGDPENEFCFLKWDDGEYEFSTKLTEESVSQGITVAEYSVKTFDHEGQEIDIQFLFAKKLA